MRKRHPALFDVEPKPRAKPRVLMHVIDAGDCGDCERGEHDVRLRCNRCEHETDWIRLKTADAKCGIPCPTCNKVERVNAT